VKQKNFNVTSFKDVENKLVLLHIALHIVVKYSLRHGVELGRYRGFPK
jgi:hypothetical protein